MMKKQTKFISLTLLLSLFSQFLLFGQTESKIYFNGYNVVQYKGPIRNGKNKYKPTFTNMVEERIGGRIIINSTQKTFIIKWIDGYEWVCKYTNIETEAGREAWYGDVTRTLYKGKWTDDSTDAMLIITVTKSSGCITSLKSRKVIDTEYGIDTWKKTFTFATGGDCFDKSFDLSSAIKQKQNEQESKEASEGNSNLRNIELEKLRQIELARQRKAAEEEHLYKEKKEMQTTQYNNHKMNTSNIEKKNQDSGLVFGIAYHLAGRSSLSLPKPKYPGYNEGIVVVKITVDKLGKVTNAEPGARGTNLMDEKYWEAVKEAAYKAKFNTDEAAPAFQIGTIAYTIY